MFAYASKRKQILKQKDWYRQEEPNIQYQINKRGEISQLLNVNLLSGFIVALGEVFGINKILPKMWPTSPMCCVYRIESFIQILASYQCSLRVRASLHGLYSMNCCLKGLSQFNLLNVMWGLNFFSLQGLRTVHCCCPVSISLTRKPLN